MSEIKFTCPSCSQHVACDASHAGENFPCPACAMLVRVPSDAGFAEASIAAPASPSAPSAPSVTAELGNIFYSDAQPTGDGSGHESSGAHQESPSKPASDANHSAGPQAPEKTTTVAAEHRSDMRCVCPVCKSELRVSLEMALPATDATQHLSLEEREQKIAAAREANPVGLHPNFKPRLDKILGDEEHKEAA
jgi:hypothetical protein